MIPELNASPLNMTISGVPLRPLGSPWVPLGPLGFPLVPGHQWHFSCAQNILGLCQGQGQGLRRSGLLGFFEAKMRGKAPWLRKKLGNWGICRLSDFFRVCSLAQW